MTIFVISSFNLKYQHVKLFVHPLRGSLAHGCVIIFQSSANK